MHTIRLWVLTAFSLWCLGACSISLASEALLKVPISPTLGPMKGAPLTQALTEIGLHVSEGYVLFGVELQLKEGREPKVGLDPSTATNLGSALRNILHQLDNYSFEIVSDHLVNIFPAGAKRDVDDPLNTPVQKFDIVDEQADWILAKPQEAIRELRSRLSGGQDHNGQLASFLGPGLRSIGLNVTLHLHNVTVREILNAVAVATEEFPTDRPPLGWACSSDMPKGTSRQEIFPCKVLNTAPRNWKAKPGDRTTSEQP